MTTTTQTDHHDFITIIGSDMAAIAQEFQAQGLSEKDYSIVHRAGRHRFTHVDGGTISTMFEGRPLIAATFQRRADA